MKLQVINCVEIIMCIKKKYSTVSSIYDAIYILHNKMKMKNKIPHCRQKQVQTKSENRLTEVKLTPLTHRYMTAHFPGLIQVVQ